jgi:hypothetical protein
MMDKATPNKIRAPTDHCLHSAFCKLDVGWNVGR